MLTKDLIRARISGDALRPQFVAIDDAALLDLAEQLLSLYVVGDKPTRAEIDEAAGPLVNAYRDVKLARGLHKLLQDRAEFTHALELDYPALRRQLFAASASQLSRSAPLDVEEFRRAAIAGAAVPPEFVEQGIYADLPETEELVSFKELSPVQLLERYNLSLVQSLLLHADQLEIVVASADAAKLRRLFKYLRFFRLLARLYRHPRDRSAIRVVIDGPASLLDQSKRYGLQLASFFPAVCALDSWLLKTSVEWKDRQRPLRLSDKQGLVCPYTHFGAYVPEEIKLFHRHFQATVQGWQIVGHTPFLEAGGQEIVFPDLSFQREGGAVIHLELFHRWHATQLAQRLALLAEQPRLPLIVGVDRYLAEKPEIAAALEASAAFRQRGFLFRDYPAVQRVRECLERASGTGEVELPL